MHSVRVAFDLQWRSHMFQRQSKRIISSLIALSVVLSVYIAKPVDVSADTYIQADTVYTVSSSDYVISPDGYLYSRYFVPQETGYYVYEGNMDYFSLDVLDDDGYYVSAPDGYDAIRTEYDYIIQEYPITNKQYYLQAGIQYELRGLYDEISSECIGKYSIRRITDYFEFKATAPDQMVEAYKDTPFTCAVDIDISKDYNAEDISCEWTFNTETLNGTGTEITFNPNDYIDFSGDFQEGENYDLWCAVTYTDGESWYSRWVHFLVFAYTSKLSSVTWADYDGNVGAQNHNIWYKSSYPDNYYDIKFGVEAGSDVDCTISYNWYEVDLDKESAGIVDKSQLYIPVEGASGSSIQIVNRLNNPYFVFDSDGHLSIRKRFICVVTFTADNDTIQKEVPFYINYEPDALYYDYSSDFIYVRKGDTVELPVTGSITTTELPAGVSMSFTWINFLDRPEYENVSFCSGDEFRDVFDNISRDNSYKLLNISGASASIDTSKLTWLDVDGKKISYVAVAYQPEYNDIPCFMENGYIVFKLVDITGLPIDDLVSATYKYHDYFVTTQSNRSSEFFVVDAKAFPGCNISYQWYKIDSDKEKAGNYTNREELYIPISGQTGRSFVTSYEDRTMDKLGTPYIEYNESNIAQVYMDIVCVVTFTFGDQTVKKEVPFKLKFESYVYYMGLKELYVKSTDQVLMPESCGTYEDQPTDTAIIDDSNCPSILSYKYTWIGFDTKKDFSFYEYDDYSCQSIYNIWDQFSSDYTIIGTGKSATIDMSDLTKFTHGEDKYTFIACVYEPTYNGNVIRCDNVQSGYVIFKVYFTDLVSPDTSGIAVTAENFPDAKFREYVASKIDKNNSGYISEDELNSTTYINIDNLGITDLTGLQYFKDIFSLSCAGNNFKTLDLSEFVNLEFLDCSGNGITSLILPDSDNLFSFYCNNNSIKTLDLSGFTDLHYLDCSNNGMTSLVLPNNNRLYNLVMNGNNISTFDISNYSRLKYYYQNGLYYSVGTGAKAYGYVDTESYIFGGRIEISNGIQIDNSTTVLNATATNKAFTIFDLSVSQDDNVINLQWNAIPGAVHYDVYRSFDSGNVRYFNSADETCYVDEDVTEGTEYTYVIIAYDEEYHALSYSEFTKVTCTSVEEPIKITQQPEDYLGLEGTTAMFSVVAEGNSLTYQWQLKKGSSWANLTSGGALTDTMSIKADKSKEGKIYRCLITDAEGNFVTTDEVTITIKEPAIVITSQPESYSGVIGSTAKFTVAAEGEGLTYQWQLKKGSKWADLTTGGATTPTLSIKVDAAKDGKVYRCLITDVNGEQLASEEATITITEPSITINTQPVSYSGVVGTTAKFTVAAEGENLTYQWQLKKGSSWANLSAGGATTPTLSVKVDTSKDGKVYRCLISSGGEQLATDEVSITVTEPTNAIVITSQPSDYVGLEGSTAKFTVVAEGTGLSYQWQLKKGSSWANLSAGGATTSTLSIKVDSGKNGKIYRCLIKDADGNELASEGASITIKEPSIFIDTQPEDYEGKVGTTAKFTVEATGEGLTYQWQLKKGSSWANLTSGGATTDTMTIKVDSGKNGKVYRCLITDANGEELASQEVTIRVVFGQASPEIPFMNAAAPAESENTNAGQPRTESPASPETPAAQTAPASEAAPAVPVEVSEPAPSVPESVPAEPVVATE